MIPRAEDVVEALARLQPELREQGVRSLFLFGSVARGDQAAHSDVDVAVWIDPEKTPSTSFGYEADLSTDLMRALGRNDVDVIRLNAAPPLLYHRVLRDGVRILARDLRETTVREGRALSRWCDWAPTQARIDALLAARHRDRDVPR